uniref:ATP-dependent DNA helicase PIF1-like n=1 Tax=Erigeron canadensis TaxID=72917 RepID=UPI001CB8F685|nr:ATP-dependent DNA helicase PIF1-like [Erigeron canadensis]
MRLQHGCPSNEIAETKAFAEWILKIGEGKIGGSNDGEDIVEFPDDVIIRSTGDHIQSITSLVPSDKRIPFWFQRRQFPLSVCFAMTINKSQGQSLSNVGLYLRRPVFTHGQLYVAVSRVTSKRGLKVLISDEGGHSTNKTKNVVYKEVLQSL